MEIALIYDLLIILAAGLAAAILCRRFRLSVLVGYLLAGVLVGRGGLGWVIDQEHQLAYLAEAGVFLLLFTIGLEFSLDELSRLGRQLLVGGSVQMALVAGPVAGFLWLRGAGWQSAVLIAAAVSFSSTVLVFKALMEAGHTHLPHGRRAIAILLFQDIALVPLLLLVPVLTGGDETPGMGGLALLALKSLLFVLGVVVLRQVLARSIVPSLAGYRSPELIVLFTLVSLGAITLAAYGLGLPPPIGALAAGLVFGGNRWTQQIDALVLPFRETFAAVFFVSLGLLLDTQLLWREPWLLLAALAGLVCVKALAAVVALRCTGLNPRDSACTGIGLAHVGEFAFVLTLFGADAGVVTETDYQRVVAISVGSLILTPILLTWSLRAVRPTRDSEREPGFAVQRQLGGSREAVVVGAGPIGRQVVSQLELAGWDVCIIDLSPVNLYPFAQAGFRTVAGDATDGSALEPARVERAALVIVSVPDDGAAIRIVQAVRSRNPDARVVVRCRYQANVSPLRKAGAADVISEEIEAAGALLGAIHSL